MPPERLLEVGLRPGPPLTWAKASNRGRLSHLRKAKDLAQRATSPGVRLGTWGSRSAAKRWNTCVWWKPSLPEGQSGPRRLPGGPAHRPAAAALGAGVCN